MHGEVTDQEVDDWVAVGALMLQGGDGVTVHGDLLAAILTLLDRECPIRTADLDHPVIARVKKKFDEFTAPDRHWVAWWGEAGQRPQQVFAHDDEVDARGRLVRLMEKRLARDCGTEAEVADLQSQMNAIDYSLESVVRWTDPFLRIEHEYRLDSCQCPDSDPSRCMLFKRVRRGEYRPRGETAS